MAALLLGFLAAGYVGATQLGNFSPGGLGTTALLVPVTFGVVHTLVLAAGELTWPRPEGEVRRARLVHRGLLDAAPRWLVRLGGSRGAGLLTLVGGALLADADGRSVSSGSELGVGQLSATASPFPGVFYEVPAGIGLLVLAVVTAVALRIVANRPAVATADEGIESRCAGPRRTACSGWRWACRCSSPAACCSSAARALHSVATSIQSSGLLEVAGVASSLIGGAAMLAGVVVACIRAPGVPADAPAVPVG